MVKRTTVSLDPAVYAKAKARMKQFGYKKFSTLVAALIEMDHDSGGLIHLTENGKTVKHALYPSSSLILEPTVREQALALVQQHSKQIGEAQQPTAPSGGPAKVGRGRSSSQRSSTKRGQ